MNAFASTAHPAELPVTASPAAGALARVPLGVLLALIAVLVPGQSAALLDRPLEWADLLGR